jgi:hypothetical protein
MNILTDSLSYPVRGSGKYLLLTLAVFSLISSIASFAPVIGAITSLILFGYMCSVYFQIIQSTAVGGKEAPEFPETSNLVDDIIWPAAQVVSVVFVSFLPLIAAGLVLRDANPSPLVIYGLTGFGILYAPMAILAVSVLGYLGAMSPHIVLPAIFRCGWLYLLGVVLLCLLYFLEGRVDAVFGKYLIFRTLVMAVVGGYVLMANGRMLGLIFRQRREELCWI